MISFNHEAINIETLSPGEKTTILGFVHKIDVTIATLNDLQKIAVVKKRLKKTDKEKVS